MAPPKCRTRFFILALTVLIVSVVWSDERSTNEPAWRVPSRWARKENPVPKNERSVANGQRLYEQECLTCHGVQGKGDGPSSDVFEEEVRDLTEPEVSNQTDGALFFKITAGRESMPSFRKLMTDDEKWEVVCYLRTLMPRP